MPKIRQGKIRQALDALDEQHRVVQTTKSPDGLAEAMAELEKRFAYAAKLGGEIEMKAQRGSKKAQKVLDELGSRFDRSYEKLTRSSQHAQNIYRLSLDFLLADVKDLPKE